MLGPGTFELTGPDGSPFYDAAERGHLADARLLLGVTLALGGSSLLVLAAAVVRWPQRRAATWRAISHAGLVTAAGVIVIALISLVAFDTLFTLFHRVFFPGGNWAFDPASQRLVQLYPFGFWQIAAAALGTVLVILGLGAWLLGRGRAARELARAEQARPTQTAEAG